jgi:hypothetical protein
MLFGATSRLGPPFRLVEQDQSRLETEAELVPGGKGGQNHQAHLERMHVIALRPSGSAQQPSRNQTQTKQPRMDTNERELREEKHEPRTDPHETWQNDEAI